jgi:hypothetical protein
MGSGQHRQRRGSRPRSAPHKHGGASSTGSNGRATTQLIPSIIPTNSNATNGANGAHGVNGNGVNRSALGYEDTEDELESDLESSSSANQEAGTPVALSADLQDEPLSSASSPQEPQEAQEAEEDAPTEREITAPGRGRFYAPGQTRPRFERVERAPVPPPSAIASTPPTAPRRAERIERTERAYEDGALNDAGYAQGNGHNASTPDDEAEYTGPRGDVRGSVGALIDSLHEVFARDRAIASQSSVARCGVCYLHFPTEELIYREDDGFYVCESCAHALGLARVPMVRRQQRQ